MIDVIYVKLSQITRKSITGLVNHNDLFKKLLIIESRYICNYASICIMNESVL